MLRLRTLIPLALTAMALSFDSAWSRGGSEVIDQALEAIASLSEPVSGNALVVLAEVMLRFIVDNATLMPHTCDPAAWEPWTAQCMPIDDDPLGTFHIPDDLARLIHVWFEGGEATEFCMGAVSSAFLVRGQ